MQSNAYFRDIKYGNYCKAAINNKVQNYTLLTGYSKISGQISKRIMPQIFSSEKSICENRMSCSGD